MRWFCGTFPKVLFYKGIYIDKMVLKKTRNHKRHLQKSRKLRGGALTQEQENLLRMLSKLLAWGSLGYISWCTVTPVVEIILSLLEASNVSYITMYFYELLWVNLVSTLSSVSGAATSAGSAVLGSLNLLAKAGNTCAAAHAVLRLANPLYKFFLGNIKRIIEVMENPLNINQKIRELPMASKAIVETFLRDYKTMGGHAIMGVDKTTSAIRQLYAKLGMVFNQVEDNVKTALPKLISESERNAARENMEWLKTYEDFIFQILTKVVEGGEYGSSKYGKSKEILSRCAKGTLSAAIYAKGWVSYFFECMNAPMERHLEDFVVSRKRPRSPSPPPSADLESMAVKMMTKTTGGDSDSQKRLKVALTSSPEQTAEVVQMVKDIVPEPAQIKKLVRSLNVCARAASAPPDSRYTSAPMIRPRAASEIPTEAPLFVRRRSVNKMPTIEQSPEKIQSTEKLGSKLKSEGGNYPSTIERKGSKSNKKTNSNKKKQLGGKTRKHKH